MSRESETTARTARAVTCSLTPHVQFKLEAGGGLAVGGYGILSCRKPEKRSLFAKVVLQIMPASSNPAIPAPWEPQADNERLFRKGVSTRRVKPRIETPPVFYAACDSTLSFRTKATLKIGGRSGVTTTTYSAPVHPAC